MDLQNARINTAGAYIWVDGFYPFAIGVRTHNGCIPVVRLGGRREGAETGWQCAWREVHEESSLDVQPLIPPRTYLADGDQRDSELREIRWEHPSEEADPLLIVAYRREAGILLSLMYLAQADGFPKPSSEVKGLLLLKKEEVRWLCQESVTLRQYLDRGGNALFDYQFDQNLILEPFIQLRYLSEILRMHPDISPMKGAPSIIPDC
jgi:hypothetical protein